MFEDFELNPMVAGLSVLAGIIAIASMQTVQVGLIWKIGALILTPIVSYFVLSGILNR